MISALLALKEDGCVSVRRGLLQSQRKIRIPTVCHRQTITARRVGRKIAAETLRELADNASKSLWKRSYLPVRAMSAQMMSAQELAEVLQLPDPVVLLAALVVVEPVDLDVLLCRGLCR